MFDRQPFDRPGRREAEIDGDATTPIRFNAKSAPASDATARRTETDLERRIGLGHTSVGDARPRDPDPLVLVVIGPDGAVPATERAVAGGRQAGVTLEGPLKRAAIGRACQRIG